MPRRPRFSLTNYPLHVVQRGNDRQPCFLGEPDFRAYLDALSEASSHYGVRIHAYVLMTNHVHLLATPLVVGAVSRMMQSVGARYVSYVNATYRRSGTLREGRYHACLVDGDAYVLAVCRYIDLNPLRARMVAHPISWRWSSYATLAGLRSDALVIPHPSLASLADAPGVGYARWCGTPTHPDSDTRGGEARRRTTASYLRYVRQPRASWSTGRSRSRRASRR